MIRNNITVAIIDMTDNQKLLENNPKNILNETVCPLPQKLNTSLESNENLTINGAIRSGRKFAWTKEWRSLIDPFFLNPALLIRPHCRPKKSNQYA